MTTSIAPTLCPVCGYAMDAATALSGGPRPHAGDVGLCLSCGAILVYDADVRPTRTATEAELATMPLRVLDAARIIRKRGPIQREGARA